MIGIGFGTNTPVDIIAFRWVVHRSISLIPVTEALATGCLTAAIIVGDDVTLTIYRIFASTDPGNR